MLNLVVNSNIIRPLSIQGLINISQFVNGNYLFLNNFDFHHWMSCIEPYAVNIHLHFI